MRDQAAVDQVLDVRGKQREARGFLVNRGAKDEKAKQGMKRRFFGSAPERTFQVDLAIVSALKNVVYGLLAKAGASQCLAQQGQIASSIRPKRTLKGTFRLNFFRQLNLPHWSLPTIRLSLSRQALTQANHFFDRAFRPEVESEPSLFTIIACTRSLCAFRNSSGILQGTSLATGITSGFARKE